MPDGELLRAFDALATHAKLSDLVAITRAVALAAAEQRKSAWTDAVKVKAQAEELKVGAEDATTPFGDALAVLERGPQTEGERPLACALWAHVVAEAKPKGRDEEDRLAADVLWLAAHTPFDATALVDRALGDAAVELWDAIADRVRKIDQGKLPELGRAEALLGCAALAASTSTAAQKHATALAAELKDPALLRALGAGKPRHVEEKIAGELTMAPRGPVATTLLALTGLLFVIQGARLLARVALAYKRPAEAVISNDGVRVHARTELLGRTVREEDIVIRRESLVRTTREVRYPRVAFYAGLLALAVGSYVGVATLMDGVRAASPSLLLTGLLVIAAGVLLDLVLGSVAPGSLGRCRVVFVPAKGASVCLGYVDAKLADAALARVASA